MSSAADPLGDADGHAIHDVFLDALGECRAGDVAQLQSSCRKKWRTCRFGTINGWPGETGNPSRIAVARLLARTMRSSGSAQNGQVLGVIQR